METTTATGNYPFLAGGGELGECIRTYNWTSTSLGMPDGWPLSLRTTVGLVLHSAFPMFLFWGPDLVCFYNDAYRPSLGENGKHPAIGKRGADVWPEIWDFIGPMIQQVIDTGKPTFYEDQLVPIYRNGRLEDVYWTFSYGPAYGDDGRIAGVLVTCTETTKQVLAQQQLTTSREQLRRLIADAPVAMALFSGPQFVITLANERVLAFWGRNREQVLNKPLFDALPEASGQGFEELLMQVYTTGERLVANELPVTLERNGRLEQTYINFTYDPFREADDTITGIIVVCVEMTEQVLARRKVGESEARFQAAIAAVQGVLWTNNAIGQMEGLQPGWALLTGQTYDEYQGYGWAGVVHPDDAQPTVEAWEAAVRERRTFVFEHRVRRENGQWGLFSVRAIPLLNVDATIREWVGVHTDVTAQREAVQALEASEQFSRNLFHSSPVANLVLTGDEMTIRTINAGMLAMLGRNADIIGKPFMVAMPELIATPLMGRLRQVLTTGEAYVQPEERIELVRYGEPHTGYYNYVYTPLEDADGTRSGVVVTAIEITQQVLARQRVEAAQADLYQTNQRLNLALDAGQLGSYELELETGLMICTPQCKANYGQPADAVFNFPDLLNVMAIEDRERVQQAVAHAVDTQTTYHAEYRVRWPDGSLHWVKASGQPIYQLDGQPVKVVGVTQDITAQRMAREELERQVQQRTAQLHDSIQDLKRSNDNLEKFAYVASHDLQEPLRKIQSFGDLLKNQYGAQLGDGVEHLERMQTAASRMSTLIRDLLTYSRISTQQNTIASVSLTNIANTAVADLDLMIAETGAVVTVDPLPTIEGDPLQLGQLFQNLLSNALKFRRVEVVPVIYISSQLVSHADLSPLLKPVRPAPVYYRIDMADNGIGFDEKYLDRIFQVFQRLSGRSQYAGTGIGLAICEKVVANHGGAITASSQPGRGTTFSAFFPVNNPVKRYFTA